MSKDNKKAEERKSTIFVGGKYRINMTETVYDVCRGIKESTDGYIYGYNSGKMNLIIDISKISHIISIEEDDTPKDTGGYIHVTD